MQVEAMEPETNMSAKERIVSAAETAGAGRSEAVVRTINRVLGAPEAAAMALTIAGETLDDLKTRTEDRLAEAAMNLAERADNAWARFTGRVTEVRDRAVAKAKDLENRAVKFGLTTGTKIEDRIVAICESPAGLREARAGALETKAAAMEIDLSDLLDDQEAKQLGLSKEQQDALNKLLQKQQEKMQALQERHESAKGKLQDRIESAKTGAAEHKAKASEHRAAVEKRRIFKGLLARFNA